MGTSASAYELAGKLELAGQRIQGSTREGVREGAIAAQAIWEAELFGAVGRRRLSNVGRGGARVGVRFTNPTSDVNPKSIVRFVGPVHLVNSGTRPHWISPRNANSFGRSRGKGAFALWFPDGEVRAFPVFHPGTAGKQFFPRARDRAAEVVPQVIARAEHRALLSAFAA